MPVMVVDDVITTGGSIRESCERVTAEGAKVVFATTLLDRGQVAAPMFDDLGITYRPLLTYRDIGIDPI
jgi:orotate phosphoribosyltransferase